jgi:hypothetical protein
VDELELKPLVLALTLVASCVSPERTPPADPGPHETQLHHERLVLAPAAGDWVGPWEPTPFPSDELLPSWNVRCPEGCAFRVDLEVDAGPGTRASGWLDLGGWGEWPEAQRSPTESPLAKVEVDLLKAESAVTRVRWRIRARGPVAVEVQRRALCATRTAAIGPALERGGPPQAVRLELSLRRQFDEPPELGPRICSPTSVSMLLEFRGVSLPTGEVAATLYDAEHDLYGNWNRAVEGAFLLGVPGYLTRIGSWGEAERHLRRGQPLVISIGVDPGELSGAPYPQTAGHLVVLAGLDGRERAIVYDPAVRAPEVEPRSYLLDELEQVWLRRGGFAYVLEPR